MQTVERSNVLASGSDGSAALAPRLPPERQRCAIVFNVSSAARTAPPDLSTRIAEPMVGIEVLWTQWSDDSMAYVLGTAGRAVAECVADAYLEARERLECAFLAAWTPPAHEPRAAA